jgi:hypothetical protein
MNGPFEIELKIHLTDGERVAVAAYELPVGVYPTKEDIQKAIATSLAKTQSEFGNDFRLETRHEFENEILSDRYGGMTPEFATEETWDE